MVAQFVQGSPGHLAGLINDPSEIEDLFMDLPPASDVPAGSMERLANLVEAKRKEFIERGPKMLEITQGAAISIDKSWHGVHYLLCGAAEPTTTLISKAIMGGTEVGDDFSGYGP